MLSPVLHLCTETFDVHLLKIKNQLWSKLINNSDITLHK